MVRSKSNVGDFSSAFRGRSPRVLAAQSKVGGVFTVEGYYPVAAPLSLIQHLEKLGKEDWIQRACFNIRKLGVIAASAFWLLPHSISKDLETPQLKFVNGGHNLVVTTGLTDIVDKYFKGSAYTAAHYVGLTDGTPTVAAGDTMASHVGWTEITNYTEANRQTYVAGTVTAGAVDNSGSKATFTADTGGFTTGGAFLTTDNTRGGTSGTLVCAVAFTGGDEVLSVAETVSVQYDFSASDDGV